MYFKRRKVRECMIFIVNFFTKISIPEKFHKQEFFEILETIILILDKNFTQMFNKSPLPKNNKLYARLKLEYISKRLPKTLQIFTISLSSIHLILFVFLQRLSLSRKRSISNSCLCRTQSFFL